MEDTTFVSELCNQQYAHLESRGLFRGPHLLSGGTSQLPAFPLLVDQPNIKPVGGKSQVPFSTHKDLDLAVLPEYQILLKQE